MVTIRRRPVSRIRLAIHCVGFLLVLHITGGRASAITCYWPTYTPDAGCTTYQTLLPGASSGWRPPTTITGNAQRFERARQNGTGTRDVELWQYYRPDNSIQKISVHLVGTVLFETQFTDELVLNNLIKNVGASGAFLAAHRRF